MTYTVKDITNKHCPECGSRELRLLGTAHAEASPDGVIRIAGCCDPDFQSLDGYVQCEHCGHEVCLSEGETLPDAA